MRRPFKELELAGEEEPGWEQQNLPEFWLNKLLLDFKLATAVAL